MSDDGTTFIPLRKMIAMEVKRNKRCKYMFTGVEQIAPLVFDWDEGEHEDTDEIHIIERTLPLGEVNYCYWLAMISENHPTSIPFRHYGLWGKRTGRESLGICESTESELDMDDHTTKYGMCRFDKAKMNYAISRLLGERFGYDSCIVLTREEIPLNVFHKFIMIETNHPFFSWEKEHVCLDFDKLAAYILSINAVLLQCSEGGGGKMLLAIMNE